MQGNPRRRPRLTRRVQSAHKYEISAVATAGDTESEAAKEITMLRSLCHPNIVRLVEVIGEPSLAASASSCRQACLWCLHHS